MKRRIDQRCNHIMTEVLLWGKTKSWLRLSTVLLLSLCIVLTGGGGNGNSGAQPEAKDSAEQTTPGRTGIRSNHLR